jgi:hypothetical protein
MTKKALQYILLILLTAFSFLFSPKPDKNEGPDKECPVTYIRLNEFMGFPMNCDAIEYMGGSVNPGYLFEQNYTRQSRPLYLLSGAVIGYGLYFLSTPFHHSVKNSVKGQFNNQIPDEKISLYISHYAGLILINLMVLVFSLFLFEKIVLHFTGYWKNGNIMRFSFLLMLVSNHVTKTFFWTPHQQMFNTLLPLLAIWLFISVLKNNSGLRLYFISGLLCGLLLLFYGSFLILLPVLLISIFCKYLLTPQKKIHYYIKAVFLVLFSFCLPILLWILILKLTGIDFYSHETASFREFVWVIDSLKNTDSNLPAMLATNLHTYLATTAILIFPFLFLLISLLINQHYTKRFTIYKKTNHLHISFILPFLLIFIFFWLMGYYTDRLTYTSAPVIICYAAVLLNKYQLNRIANIFLLFMILAWHFFILLFEMPHFSDRFYY